MRVFVSGATGYIGMQLVKRLLQQGNLVHALCRSESKADLIREKGVRLFQGDILDRDSLRRAMSGCDRAYHVAAFAGIWTRDPSVIFRINVEGSLNVIEEAKKSGIGRVVVCSTAGVFGPSAGEPVTEEAPPPLTFFTPYEASKMKMEESLLRRVEKIPEVVVVNPTRVYGPGYLSESNGVTRMIIRYLQGKWHVLPGHGNSVGNYVHVEDVVSGHILAMEKGRPGERYILGGDHLTYRELFAFVRRASGKNRRLYPVPLWLMLSVAAAMKGWAGISGRPPLIVPGLVKKFIHHWKASSGKAKRELGYDPLSAEGGIRQTVRWIESQINTNLHK